MFAVGGVLFETLNLLVEGIYYFLKWSRKILRNQVTFSYRREILEGWLGCCRFGGRVFGSPSKL